MKALPNGSGFTAEWSGDAFRQVGVVIWRCGALSGQAPAVVVCMCAPLREVVIRVSVPRRVIGPPSARRAVLVFSIGYFPTAQAVRPKMSEY